MLRTLLGFDSELDSQLIAIINKSSNEAKWRKNNPNNNEAIKTNTNNRIMCATILVDVFGEVVPEHWFFNEREMRKLNQKAIRTKIKKLGYIPKFCIT